MGFFDDVPSNPSEDMPQGRPWDPPVAEFPRVAKPDALLLVRTDVVAVAVEAVWAFKEGFEFWVKAVFRDRGPALELEPNEESLHFGLQFADGRKVANTGRAPGPAGSVATQLLLRPINFGGGIYHQKRSYWVWPLPPPGPLAFVCEWRVFDIQEQRAEVEAQLILDAAQHSMEVWPEDSS
jgi:hypothetical protein